MLQKALLIAVGFIFGLAVKHYGSSPTEPTAIELGDLPEPYYSVLWENEYVRIVEHRMQPGDIEPMHTHPEMLAYILEDSALSITEADGTISELQLTAGDFQHLPTWTHSIENSGNSDLHTLLVELKH